MSQKRVTYIKLNNLTKQDELVPSILQRLELQELSDDS